MSTRDVWERRVARWEKSGLSRAEFADREGGPVKIFYQLATVT